jgi:hypothetical protein
MTSLVLRLNSSLFDIYLISGPTDAINFKVVWLRRLTLPPKLLRSPELLPGRVAVGSPVLGRDVGASTGGDGAGEA